MNTKHKIIAGARKEFSDKGFEGARVDRIARDAGVNKAMIYYHFGSKEKLYQAVIDDVFSAVKNFVARALVESADLEGLFAEMSGFYLEFFESSPQLAPLVLREMAAGGERIRGVLAQMVSETGARQKVGELLEAGIRDGSLRRLDIIQTFVSFIGMNLFYLFFSPVLNSIWEIEDESGFRRSRPEAVADLFLNGIRFR